MKDLFETANNEIHHLNDWFRANKISLNAGKTIYLSLLAAIT